MLLLPSQLNISKMSRMHRLHRPTVHPHVHKLTHKWAIWDVSLVSFVLLWANFTEAKALTFILLHLYIIKLRQEFGFLARRYINTPSVKDAACPDLTCLHIYLLQRHNKEHLQLFLHCDNLFGTVKCRGIWKLAVIGADFQMTLMNLPVLFRFCRWTDSQQMTGVWRDEIIFLFLQSVKETKNM